jgi:hypothetical protein
MAMIIEIENLFSFLLGKDFKIIKETESNYFSAIYYQRKSLVIYVSVDTMENIVRIYLMKTLNNEIPFIDDKERVSLLSEAGKKYISIVNKSKIQEADSFFEKYKNEGENKELIKQARELYLVIDFLI